MGKLDDLEISVSEVVDYMRISGTFAPALQKVIERKIAAASAKERGIEVSDEELQKVADGFRQMMGLTKAADTEEWLNSQGLSLETLENHLEMNALVSKFMDELEKDADASEIMSSPEVKDRIRESAFRNWIKGQLT